MNTFGAMMACPMRGPLIGLAMIAHLSRTDRTAHAEVIAIGMGRAEEMCSVQ